MKGQSPFNTFRTNTDVTIVEPIVEYLDIDPVTSVETVKKLKVADYHKVFPFETKEYSLKDLLAAGVPLEQVPTHLYDSNDPTDSPYTQEELLDKAIEISEKLNPTTENKTEE